MSKGKTRDNGKKQGKEERKERYEILYENLMSEFKFLAEAMEVMKDSLRADIYELKGEMKKDKYLLELALRSHSKEIKGVREEVVINRKWILENKEAIERVENKLDRHDNLIMKHERALAAA